MEDLARAILLAANAGPAPGIYSVTDGEEYRINEIESAIYAALGKTLPRWRAPAVLLYCRRRTGWIDGQIRRAK